MVPPNLVIASLIIANLRRGLSAQNAFALGNALPASMLCIAISDAVLLLSER
jgi:hypothetical protein